MTDMTDMTREPLPAPPRTPELDAVPELGAGQPMAGPRPTLTIRCREDGPLVIDLLAGGGCDFRVVDHRGREFRLPTHKKAVALCRCGGSGNRPFCDGSHREGGFRAAEPAGDPMPGPWVVPGSGSE
jgi:CDGSH-type Zn-finger protein